MGPGQTSGMQLPAVLNTKLLSPSDPRLHYYYGQPMGQYPQGGMGDQQSYGLPQQNEQRRLVGRNDQRGGSRPVMQAKTSQAAKATPTPVQVSFGQSRNSRQKELASILRDPDVESWSAKTFDTRMSGYRLQDFRVGVNYTSLTRNGIENLESMSNGQVDTKVIEDDMRVRCMVPLFQNMSFTGWAFNEAVLGKRDLDPISDKTELYLRCILNTTEATFNTVKTSEMKIKGKTGLPIEHINTMTLALYYDLFLRRCVDPKRAMNLLTVNHLNNRMGMDYSRRDIPLQERKYLSVHYTVNEAYEFYAQKGLFWDILHY